MQSDAAPDLNAIAAHYSDMTDAQLIAAAAEYDSLIEEVKAWMRAEFSRRGLEPPLVAEEAEPSERRLVTLRQYRDSGEAMLARSVLESAGITSYLRDENTIRMEWIWSNYMGGIRLQVASDDAAAAEAILSQPVPETIALESGEQYQQPHCPRCHSIDVIFEHVSQTLPATSMLLFGLPLPARVVDAWRCKDCGLVWQDDSDTATSQDTVG